MALLLNWVSKTMIQKIGRKQLNKNLISKKRNILNRYQLPLITNLNSTKKKR